MLVRILRIIYFMIKEGIRTVLVLLFGEFRWAFWGFFLYVVMRGLGMVFELAR